MDEAKYFLEAFLLEGQSPRHNLDVMHIEKNMFGNIFNMVMDVKEKTKDNIKAIMYISLFCHHKNIELVYDGSQVRKSKVAIDKNTQLLIYQ